MVTIKKSIKKNILILIFLIFLFITPTLSQNPEGIELYVSPREGAQSDSYTLVIKVDWEKYNTQPEIEENEDFAIIGSGMSTQTKVVNGDISVSREFSFSLRAKKIGELFTPNVRISQKDKKFNIKGLRVKVSKRDLSKINTDRNIIFRQTASKLSAYTGEQIKTAMELYFKIAAYNIDFKPKQDEGFWTEDWGEIKKLNTKLGGDDYTLFKLNRSIYPLSPGTHVLKPKTMKAEVRDSKPRSIDPYNPSSIFDSFLTNRMLKKVEIQAKELEIEVLPLPKPNASLNNWDSSTTLVGTTKLETNFDSKEVKLGDTKNFKIILTSHGNLSPIKEIPFPSNDTYQVYQELNEFKKKETTSGIVMQKVFNVSLVPSKPGEIDLPNINISYFDVKTKAYKKTSIENLTFKVAGEISKNEESEIDKTPYTNSEPIKELTYKEKSFFQKLSEQISTGLAIFILTLLLLIAFLGYLFKNLTKEKDKKKIELYSNLETAKDLNELSKSFKSFLAYTLNCSENSDLRAKTKNKITDKDTELGTLNLLDDLEITRYSKESNNDFTNLKQKAIKLSKSI